MAEHPERVSTQTFARSAATATQQPHRSRAAATTIISQSQSFLKGGSYSQGTCRTTTCNDCAVDCSHVNCCFSHCCCAALLLLTCIYPAYRLLFGCGVVTD